MFKSKIDFPLYFIVFVIFASVLSLLYLYKKSALVAYENLVSLFENNSEDKMVLLDENGFIVGVSQDFLKFLGYRKFDLVGKHFKVFFVDALNYMFSKDKITDFFSGVRTFKMADGRWIDVELISIKVFVKKYSQEIFIIYCRTPDIEFVKKRYNDRDLKCLHEISKIVEQEDQSLHLILQRIVNIIPSIWFDPKNVCVRIMIDNLGEFKTENFIKTDWKIIKEIRIIDRHFGYVEVYFIQCLKSFFKKGSLNIPKHDILFDVLAKIISRIVQRFEDQQFLKDNEAFFRTIISASQDAIIIVNSEGEINLFNCSAERMFGYASHEIIGKPLDILIPEQYREEHKSHVIKFFANYGRNVCNPILETLALAKNGTVFPVQIALSYGESLNTKFVAAAIRDVSQIKRFEREFKDIERYKATSFLARGVSHDARNLLSVILGNITLAKSFFSEKHNIFGFLEEAEKGCLMAKSLFSQLQSFSTSGESVYKAVDISQKIEEWIKLFIRGNEIEFSVNKPRELLIVRLKIVKFFQVIMNIVVNAIQAMPQGGSIYLDIKRADFQDSISFKDWEFDTYVKISIKDTGRGIPLKVISNIFDPFYTTKSKQGNSGLGLKVAKDIVKEHKGFISVESTENIGTTFIIYLPLSGETTKRKRVKRLEDNGKSLEILIMEDNKLVVETITLILKKLGHKPSVVFNGEQAIAIYKKRKEKGDCFDLLLLDKNIGLGWNAKQVLFEIKKIDPDVKAIISSGEINSLQDVAAYKEDGFNEVLSKPFTAEELKEVILKAMS
jgi:PAS domain S-box-containing protein